MIHLKHLFLLAVVGSLISYGIRFYIYIAVGVLSFSAGFLLFLPDFHWVSRKEKIPVSHGVVKVDDVKPRVPPKKTAYTMSGHSKLDHILNQILDYVIEDYIRVWYAPLTSETEFPRQLHAAMAQLLVQVSRRAQKTDWVPFIIEEIPNLVIEHICLHRKAHEQNPDAGYEEQIKLFFDMEFETSNKICRDAICTSADGELGHLRRLTDVILLAIMPPDDYRLSTYRYLMKEIVVNAILLPTVNVLADPDFVNQIIIKVCNETAFSSPYFIHSLRMSTREDEILAVKERIEAFTRKLRGRDSGGDDKAMVKAQIGSLNFLENVCDSQMTTIKRGAIQKHNGGVVETDGGGAVAQPIIDLSFDDIMRNDVAVSNFLEFLTSINEQSLFSLYLNCVAFRINSEELMAASNVPNDSVFAADPLDDNEDDEEQDKTEDGVIDDDISEDQESGIFISPPESETSPPPIAPSTIVVDLQVASDREAMDGIRAFGVSMCNAVMRTLPKIPEDSIQQILRRLTTSLDSIDPMVFVDVEEELVRILSNERCFGAFKRSPMYARTVKEIDVPELLMASPRRAPRPEETEEADGSDKSSPTTVPSVGGEASSDGSFGYRKNPSTALPSSSSSSGIGFSRRQSSPTASPNTNKADSIYADTYTGTVTSAVFTGDTLREMMRDGYVVYTVDVTCVSSISARKTSWKTYRRFSQFDDLHNFIVEQCGRLRFLRVPGKKSFSSVNREFVEKRRLELDDYLRCLCRLDANGTLPKLHPILASFLQPENWERKKVLPPGVSSFVNPLKAVGSAIISVPDTIFDGFSKMMNRRGGSVVSTAAAPSGGGGEVFRLQPDVENLMPNLAMLDQTDSDNIPFRLLFMLVEEVFNLKRQTQPFRRGTFSILMNIVQTFFGDIMNRRIVEKATSLISSEMMAKYAAMLRDALWPNGPGNGGVGAEGSPTNGAAAATNDDQSGSQRDDAMKMRTRVLCRAVMLGSVAEELASYLGIEATCGGVRRVFDLLQNPCLNRRLVHCLLDGVLHRGLQDYNELLEEVYEHLNCRR